MNSSFDNDYFIIFIRLSINWILSGSYPLFESIRSTDKFCYDKGLLKSKAIEIPDKEQLEFSSYNFCISAGVIVNGNAPTFLRVDKLCLIWLNLDTIKA